MGALGGNDLLQTWKYGPQAGAIALNTVLYQQDVSAKRSVVVQVLSIGTGATVVAEASGDGGVWETLNGYVLGGGPSTGTLFAGNTVIFPVHLPYFRIRVSVAATGGSTEMNIVSSAIPLDLPALARIRSEGLQANNTPPAGGSFRVAGVGRNSNPATNSNGNVADFLATLIGVQVTKPYAIPESAWNANLSLTTTTATPLAAAAGAGLKRHTTALQAINTGASAVDLIILDGATERWRITLPINVPVAIYFPTELLTTTNTALNANLSAAGTVRVCAQGYTAP